jgi:hypothetical protein
MHDARDAEDKRLLEDGEHTRLLENYVYLIQGRCGSTSEDDRCAPTGLGCVV